MDYNPVAESLRFNRCDRRKCVVVPIIDDLMLEHIECFLLTLERTPSLAGSITLDPVDGRVDVSNDDEAVVGLEQTFYQVSESVGMVEVCVVVLEPSTVCPISFPFDFNFTSDDGTAATPEDYGDSDMLFMFDACQRRMCVDIPIINNGVVEKTEDVEMELHTTMLLYAYGIRFNPGRGVIQIIDDDVAVVGLESTVYTVSEDVGTVKVCALASSLNTSCPVAFSFNVRLSTRDQSAESPGDYRAVAVMKTLNACRIRLCWYISIVDDTIDESDESFSFTLERTAGLDPRITLSPSAGEIIILDAEIPSAGPERFEADFGERQVVFSWSPPPVAQRNGVITSYTLSCSPSPSSLPQSPSLSGPLTVTGFSPDTPYTCSVVATNNKGSGPPANVTFNTQSDYVYFQLRLEGVIACSELITSSIEQKLEDISGAVVKQLIALCAICGFTTDNIDEEAFRCFSESPTHVTYRARLGGTLETNSSELTPLLEKWVRGGPSVTVNRVIMTVDPKCSVVISSLNEEECLPPPTASPTTSTMNPEPSIEAMDTSESTDQSSSSPNNTPAIIGAVVAILIIAITVAVIAIAALKYRHRNLSLKHAEKFELTGLPSPAMVEGTAIKTADNTAYEVMKQGVGEPENGYEMVDTSPPGGPPPADEGEKYDVPTSPHCREPLPATPTVGGAEEPNSPPPVTGGGEEEDGVYEIIPGDK